MPVTLSEKKEMVEAVFDKAMAAFGLLKAPRIAVAVSGGADSMALCRLAHRYVKRNGGELLAFTVNHGLRPESSEECFFVSEEMKQLDIPHTLLEWRENKPTAGIEKAARKARYALLFEACREKGCSNLLLGHHRQDQAETFLLREKMHSGPMGLAGMSACRSFAYGRMLRPLLSIPPESLRRYNLSIGQKWVEDPTNVSHEYERGRMRQTLTENDFETAFQKSLKYGMQRRAVEEKMSLFMRPFLDVSNMGYVFFPQKAFLELERTTALYCLAEILRSIANKAYFPSCDSLEKLLDMMRAGTFSGATLSGCRIAPASKGRFLVWREFDDLPPPLDVKGKSFFYWDRFSFLLSEPFQETVMVKPLENKMKVNEEGPKRCFYVLPALFNNEGLFLVPHLGYKQTDVSCTVTFAPLFPLLREPEWMNPVAL